MLHDQGNSLECAKLFANSYQYENAQDGTNSYMMFFINTSCSLIYDVLLEI